MPAVPTTDPRSRLRHPAPLIPPGIAPDGMPEPDPDAVPVVVSRDYSRLRALTRLWRDRADPVHQVLADKLDRCRVVPPDAVPPSVAVPGARVVFVVEGCAPASRILVMPEDHLQDGPTLAISTPMGAALLGSTAGQSLEVAERDGRRVALRLLAVDHRHGRDCARTASDRPAPDHLPGARVHSKQGEGS